MGVIPAPRAASLDPQERRHKVGVPLVEGEPVVSAETPRGSRPADEAHGDAVHVPVEQHRRVKGRVPARLPRGAGPDAHGQARAGGVGGRRYQGGPADAAVDHDVDRVAPASAFAVVGGLEVARGLVEAQAVENVVELVDCVEDLGRGCIDVCLPVGGGRGVRVREDERGRSCDCLVAGCLSDRDKRVVPAQGCVVLGAVRMPAKWRRMACLLGWR